MSAATIVRNAARLLINKDEPAINKIVSTSVQMFFYPKGADIAGGTLPVDSTFWVQPFLPNVGDEVSFYNYREVLVYGTVVAVDHHLSEDRCSVTAKTNISVVLHRVYGDQA